MKAVIVTDYGQSAQIVDVPKPELLPDSVVIQVRASSVNPVDNLLRLGYLRAAIPLQFPYRMGNDVSGTVVSVGDQVTKFKAGDEVFSRPNPMQSGTFAEQVLVKEADLAFKPSNLTHEEAASVPLVALTAWQALVDKADFKAGQKVLIHAGSGGVGAAAIQLAKHMGAGEIATTTSAANVDLVKSFGADVVIDYKSQKFEEIVNDYDMVFDTVGGETRDKSFGVLKKDGIVVSITGAPDTEGLAAKHGVRFDVFFMSASGAQLTEIAKLLEDGVLKPIIDKSYPLDNIQEALEYSLTGRAKGKIVIEVSQG